MKVPEYRVRLFLSVDLTGSTAFKHNSDDIMQWSKVFQSFYGDFPKILQKNYSELAAKRDRLEDSEKTEGCPRLWKTIGDEILFCCKLTSLVHLCVCVDSFVEALKEYGQILEGDGLDTKGNAWVASFPTPNCSIRPIISSMDTGSPLSGEKDIPTEEWEQEVDQNPQNFDFLGKGIDSGFRIAKNSAVDALTISPGLAYLLTRAAMSKNETQFSSPIWFVELQNFKGVINNKPYPVLIIDTIRNEKHQKILQAQRMFLSHSTSPASEDLNEYLKNFLELHKIEIPDVKIFARDTISPSPDFYKKYCTDWEKIKAANDSQDKNMEDSVKEEDDKSESRRHSAQNLKEMIEKILLPYNGSADISE